MPFSPRSCKFTLLTSGRPTCSLTLLLRDLDSYDTSSAIAVIRAAEKARSPAMILLFPATLRYAGKPFLKFVLDMASQASVPVAVHLDHATTAEDIDMALTFAEQGAAFDSIMIDASHADTDEENMAEVKPHIERATRAGVPVEVELGRLEGGEAGLRTITDAQLTDPTRAERFMKETGAVILAPSIGNLHGKYLKEPAFRLDMYVVAVAIRKECGVSNGTLMLFTRSSSQLERVEQDHLEERLLGESRLFKHETSHRADLRSLPDHSFVSMVPISCQILSSENVSTPGRSR